MNAFFAILSKVPKWVWVVLGIILILLILRGPMKRTWAMVKRALMKDGGDYSQGFTDGAGGTVTGAQADARKREVEALAQDAYNQLTAGIINPNARERALQALVDLNDTELRFAAQHYKMLRRDKTLYQDVDNAWMPMSSVDEALMGRLANIAMI